MMGSWIVLLILIVSGGGLAFILLLLSGANARTAAATAEKTYFLVISLPIIWIVGLLKVSTPETDPRWQLHALVALELLCGVLLVTRQKGAENFYVPYAAMNLVMAVLIWVASGYFASWHEGSFL